ncbi:hypothetical protein EV361DRAFT_660889 [Lentinula raphanica]|nr:hypothetical protein EV361DRAFT_660889 [Lentinula raphanica]
MSRHRYVKNLNIADELDDDALSDGVDEEEMTAEQQLQMNDVLEEIRNVIGEEEISGLPDSEIKDTIWYYNFNISESMQWCLDQQEKRRAAKERQGLDRTLSPPAHHYSGMQKYGGDPNELENSGRSRMPLIHLAQQRQQDWEQQRLQEEREQIVIEAAEEQDVSNVDAESLRRLSTISERTERTELSPYTPRPGYLPPPRTVSTFTDSSYGSLIDGGYLKNPARHPLDPNLIPVSPSGSAIHRLSMYEPAPSITSSGSYRQSPSPRPPSEPLPPIDTIPDIPDSQSSVVPPVPPPKPLKQSSPVKQAQSSTSAPPAKQSKLAQLASSRASTRTKSSASLSTEDTGSIKAYPAKRPESYRQSSTVSSSSSSTSTALPAPSPGHHSPSKLSLSAASSASDLPRNKTVSSFSTSAPSLTSLGVRNAVDAALELEALDRELASSRQARLPPVQKTPTEPSQPGTPTRLAGPTTSKVAGGASSDISTPQSTRPPSKLALLAQAKAQKVEAQKAAAAQKAEAEKAEAQKAILRTTRVKPPPPNHLPPEHTEYLTPIANGSSVTTAITTSYQTLYSLTDPTRVQSKEAPFVVPLAAPNYIKGVSSSASSSASGSVTKPPSKLALKAKKAQEKNSEFSQSAVSNSEPEPEVIIVPTMFLPRSSRSSASPSAFASVLVDVDLINSPQVNAGSSHRGSKGKQSISETTQGKSTPDMMRSYHERRRVPPTLSTSTSASSFAFDGPSPDDIVLNARRGTSLSHRKDRKDIPSSTGLKRASTSSKA